MFFGLFHASDRVPSCDGKEEGPSSRPRVIGEVRNHLAPDSADLADEIHRFAVTRRAKCVESGDARELLDLTGRRIDALDRVRGRDHERPAVLDPAAEDAEPRIRRIADLLARGHKLEMVARD